jgi:predicted metalloprotease with PDZ domain
MSSTQTLQYKLSSANAATSFLHINLSFETKPKAETTEIQFPAWRPGRYTLQNFIKNVRNVRFTDAKGTPLKSEKVSKDRWRVEHEKDAQIVMSYEYFARQWDAGGCRLDDTQVYVNWVCCAAFPVGYEHLPCSVELDIPENYRIACSLPLEKRKLQAKNYDELADSPMLAAAELHHAEYDLPGFPCKFHIWAHGNHNPNFKKWKEDFEAFTQEQLRMFGEIPCKEYHFFILMLPHKFYHGVEHLQSTVIALGPAESMHEKEIYDDLLGVSCHELFHVWNVKAIRPKEMMPYRFDRENYFKTCYVAEGVTTYYGDYLLLRSGIFEIEDYFRELNVMLKRWHDNYGRNNLSLADSSYDLWIDGYEAGIPHRKKSVYADGCLAALILDLTIRRATDNAASLDDVMRRLWKNFGQKGRGYSEKDFINVAEKIAKTDLSDYFEKIIYGKEDFTPFLNEALSWIGCELIFEAPKEITEYHFGLRLAGTTVQITAPNSPAEEVFSVDDEIVAIDGIKATAENIQKLFLGKDRVKIHFFRAGRLLEADLKKNEKVFFEKVSVNFVENLTEEQRENYEIWSGVSDEVDFDF